MRVLIGYDSSESTLQNLETTPRRFFPVTSLSDGRTRDLGYESFGEPTDFRVRVDGGGQRAPVTAYRVPLALPLESRGPAHRLQRPHRTFYATLQVRASLRFPTGGQGAAHFAQDLLQRLGRETPVRGDTPRPRPPPRARDVEQPGEGSVA